MCRTFARRKMFNLSELRNEKECKNHEKFKIRNTDGGHDDNHADVRTTA